MQETYRRCFEVVELTASGCPREGGNRAATHYQSNRQNQKDDAHDDSLLSNVTARSASVTTVIELSGISTAANSGSNNPSDFQTFGPPTYFIARVNIGY